MHYIILKESLMLRLPLSKGFTLHKPYSSKGLGENIGHLIIIANVPQLNIVPLHCISNTGYI